MLVYGLRIPGVRGPQDHVSVPRCQNCLLKYSIAFFTVICTNDAKATVGKTSGANTNQGSGTKLYHCILYHLHSQFKQTNKQKGQFQLKMSLINSKNYILFNFDPWHIYPLIFCDTKQEVHINHFFSIPTKDACLQEKDLCCCLSWELNQWLFSWKIIFTWKNNWQTMVIHTQVSERYFLKN